MTVTLTLAIPGMIAGETALSFLEIGICPPAVNWGVLLQDARNICSIAQSPWLFMPTIFVPFSALTSLVTVYGMRLTRTNSGLERNENRQVMSDTAIYRTIPEQVTDRLRREILSGKLRPGEPLREQEISRRFNVSRGPIREALRQLTQHGLLVLEPNKGVRVAQYLSDSVRPLTIELRRKIESFVLESIFEQITETDLLAWEHILEDIKAACERGDTASLVDHDLRFHQAIIQSHDDKDLFALWQPIALRMLMQYNRFDDLMDSYREHKRILDAIRSGDKTASLAALVANIQ